MVMMVVVVIVTIWWDDDGIGKFKSLVVGMCFNKMRPSSDNAQHQRC